MSSVAGTLEERLAPLAPIVFELADDSAEHVGHAGAAAGGGHFSLLIVSEQFSGLTRLARHRAVLDRVGDLIPHPVHALSIKALRRSEERDEVGAVVGAGYAAGSICTPT
jgi:BolA protein